MPFLDNTEIPAVSFRYGERPSDEFLTEWPQSVATEEQADGSITHSTRADPATGLSVRVHCRKFKDSPAVDWVVEFENAGSADTPPIAEILPLDLRAPMPGAEQLRIHHANGSSCRMDDFLPFTTELPPANRKTLAPVGGRSSDGVLPFMNLQRDGCGLVLAVGWSGQWEARFDCSEDSLRITAGMQKTHLQLRPGESIRTPRILLVPWEGDDDELGNNLLRRLLATHYLPRLDGRLVMPPVAQCLQSYFYLTGKASEQFEMAALPTTAKIGAEAYWVDACWYGEEGEWWQQVGSWVVNRQRFPRGLKPVSDSAHEADMKFVLWFEPERARAGSLLHREHPEFLLECDENPDNMLLNLGMPEARAYITQLLSKLIADNGVDIYRQDFNFEPLPYWRAADTPDRIGMTEIRYIEGLYALWDELPRLHPGLWIDNCASGGRRIDLETLSRSLPLWPSDFLDVVGLPRGQRLHVGDQCVNAGLARWVPLFGGAVWNFTPYGTRGETIGGFTFGAHIDHKDFPPDNSPAIVERTDVLRKGKTAMDDDFPVEDAAAAIAEWRSIRPFLLADFHLLLPLTVSYHDWCAWQFHRADLEAGVAMFFRRHRSPFPAMEVKLKEIDPDAEYEVSLSPGYRESPRQRVRGGDLARLSISIPEMPGSMLLRYSRTGAGETASAGAEPSYRGGDA